MAFLPSSQYSPLKGTLGNKTYINEDAGHHFVSMLPTIMHGCCSTWNGYRCNQWVCDSSISPYWLKISFPREIQIIITSTVLTKAENTCLPCNFTVATKYFVLNRLQKRIMTMRRQKVILLPDNDLMLDELECTCGHYSRACNKQASQHPVGDRISPCNATGFIAAGGDF